jgi:FAD:protein FMN transferase
VIEKSSASIPTGTALDFGGIGKGYLLDELAEFLDPKLTTAQLVGYWLSLGGDIICAGHDLDSQPWQVAIQSALELAKNVDIIKNEAGRKLAIATSGVTKRQGLKDGQAWHHIINPRTSKPADTNILTATVTADEAVAADVYAKCVVIAGAEQAKKYQAQGVIQSFLTQAKQDERTLAR